MSRLILIIPFIFLFVLVYFFVRGLKQDPHELPSTLINQPAPHFQLSSLTQPDYTYDETLFQGKTTLLTVWASWCPTCVDESLFLMELRLRYPKWQFIGLDEKDDPTKALAWLNTNGNPFHIVLQDTPNGDMAINYGVYGTPESFLINEKGIIIAKQIGALNEDNFQKNLLPALH